MGPSWCTRGCLRALALALLACAAPTPRPVPESRYPARAEGEANGTPRATLAAFVAAVEAQRWTEAFALLSARWRGRLTPAGLATDYAASGPVGRSSATRVQAMLSSGARLAVRKGTAVLEVGEGRAAVLLQEGDGWRVDALE